MNRAKLKSYAPQARRDFIQAMTDRAAFYGLTPTKTEPVVEKGDVAVIGGRTFSRDIAKKRAALEARIQKQGFGPTMEALAYTWFNRLVAIRYMELHGYLDHGYRVLSVRPTTDHADGTEEKTTFSSLASVKSGSSAVPEILLHAEHVDLPGLKKEAVIDLKLAGNKESELYRLLLTAQCNALHGAMPFLFEKIDDETELLLPDNLLHSDSLVRKLVNEIDEEDWQEVEIIGWLYQFYISEKKDEVIGKVVASEDIPAATQLFTPNWIVKYLVQNTLGRQWLEHHPNSPLKAKMEYYIEPAEQTPEVQAQLQQIIEARTRDNRGLAADSPLPSADYSLDPERLTLLDPACGSGHILVEAYDLFKAIYQERGYRAKDIPGLILQKNLFGLEIDDRAAQLAAFALMMKARADDRRIFDGGGQPNIVAIQESKGLNAADITRALNSHLNKEEEPKEYLFEEIQDDETPLFSRKAAIQNGPVLQSDIANLIDLFENGKTIGSLIQIPPRLAAKLPEIEKRLDDVLKHGDLTHASAHVLKPLLRQARLLARQYDGVVANPPYMGKKYLNVLIKDVINERYEAYNADLFSAFIVRLHAFCCRSGFVGAMTPNVWMFISTHEPLRDHLLDRSTMWSLIQLSTSGFDGATVHICTFVFGRSHVPCTKASFVRLTAFNGSESQAPRTLEAIRDQSVGWFHVATPDSFKKIPGKPISYWISDKLRGLFQKGVPFEDVATPRQGLGTTANHLFVRYWHEINFNGIFFGAIDRNAAIDSGRKWFPYNKGGLFRKWYGNNDSVVNWLNDGASIKEYIKDKNPNVARSESHYFKSGLTWGLITSADFSCRWMPEGFIFDVGGSSAFPPESRVHFCLGLLNSKVAALLLKAVNPTLNTQVGDLKRLPVILAKEEKIQASNEIVRKLVQLAKQDWDIAETSWDFAKASLLPDSKQSVLSECWHQFTEACAARLVEMLQLENDNNLILNELYEIQDELSPMVSEDRISLYRPDQEEDNKRLLSYAIGCMMGRYSLDKPGLIYAYSGNQGFDATQYKTFRADEDGIIPLLETDWGFRDDATNRFVEFIGVAWPREHLEENLKFVAESLGPNNNEQPRETIRRYLATGFYKHHLSMYKNRPIYWLFTSGKQRAFQCLVYLHRYNEGTLARMRTEYVIPLQGQIAARIEQLEGDKAKATSTSHRKKLQKEQDDLKKQAAELRTFEEKLKHFADQRICLDLDDGVKVNYAKFGDLLAESKTITGVKDDE